MNNPSPPKLVLLPGMGADGRLFDAQRQRFPDLVTPEWIEPEEGESLRDYAARMAEPLKENPPEYLGGCSLGGMIAAEMSLILKPKRLLLLSSCLSKRELRVWARWGAGLSRFQPRAFFNPSGPAMALFVKTFRLKDRRHEQLLYTMAKKTGADFFRWALRAIAEWEGVTPEVPVSRIVGSRDSVMRVIGTENETVIPKGGHLIVLSHAYEITRWLEEGVGAD